MKKGKSKKTKFKNMQIKRLFVASCILCVMFGVLFFASLFDKTESADIGVKSILEDSGFLNQDFEQSVAQEDTGENKLSKEFLEEAFNPCDVNGFNTKVTEDKKLIGFSLGLSSEDSFKMIKNKLTDKGWTYVSSGNPCIASFKKNSEKLTWMLVGCQEVNNETEVVICVD